MVVGLPIEKLNDALSLNENDSIVFLHIVRKDGSFVIQNAETKEDNYFNWLMEKGEFSNQNGAQAIENLKDAIINRKTYSMEVTISEENRH
ncbi:hypothetical protein NMU03_08440 [Allocoprobacillus halotolerans]|uniref:Uncharacterized protein n=1 Tax=Allocoprobacillus halotolerans TaxID=2944914 RepID=A0ABY5I6X6_9FIRM|nr:hypothetical protein [Allocoprobacillus halotolerans]UTY40765.1 hypothetical protein NMU03_08440 [Allocoprobacillus halotolerans]